MQLWRQAGSRSAVARCTGWGKNYTVLARCLVETSHADIFFCLAGHALVAKSAHRKMHWAPGSRYLQRLMPLGLSASICKCTYRWRRRLLDMYLTATASCATQFNIKTTYIYIYIYIYIYPIAFGRPATVPKCAYNRRCRSPESVLGFVGRCSPDGFQRCGGTVFPSWAVLCIQSQLQNAIKNKTERPPILKTPRSFLVYV